MSKYSPLHDLLVASSAQSVTLRIELLDALIGGLPDSARRHRAAWWANNRDRHVQANAWLDAGFRVSIVDEGSVGFVRTDADST